jgi:hypothetical protein
LVEHSGHHLGAAYHLLHGRVHRKGAARVQGPILLNSISAENNKEILTALEQNVQNPNVQNPNVQNPNVQNTNVQNINVQNPKFKCPKLFFRHRHYGHLRFRDFSFIHSVFGDLYFEHFGFQTFC